jgi:ADP-dependent NAD(P)H-hydrate dehydratase
MRPPASSRPVTPALLRRHPIPLESHGGKEGRGVALIVGGAPQMPGAIALTATGALRAGAGKLQIATSRSIAREVGIVMPEAYVIGVDETPQGGLARGGVAPILERAERADAIVIGPGMVDERGSTPALAGLVARLKVPLVLDAAALALLRERPTALRHLERRAILTPHSGEMAGLLRCEREEVEGRFAAAAAEAAQRFGAVVALKDRDTYIAAPDGESYCLRGEPVGIATSGSGDVLAGVIGGLLARGCSPLWATLWGVYAHAAAGKVLMRRTGIGFLAREIPAEIPLVLRRTGAPQTR